MDYLSNLENCSQQDLIEIYDVINKLKPKWDDRIGIKPEDWDNMPRFIINNHQKVKTKHEILNPIVEYIKNRVSEKQIMKYHHLHNCNMTPLQHEIYWIKSRISKFIGMGFHSKNCQQEITKRIYQIMEKEKEDWISKTY